MQRVYTFPEGYDSNYIHIWEKQAFVRIPVVRDGEVTYEHRNIPGDNQQEILEKATKVRADLFLELNGYEYSPDNYHRYMKPFANNKSGKKNVSPQVSIRKDTATCGYMVSTKEDGKRKRQFFSFANHGLPLKVFIKCARLVDESEGNPILSDQEYAEVYNPLDWEAMIEEKRAKLG